MSREFQASYAVSATFVHVPASGYKVLATEGGLASSLVKYMTGGSCAIVGFTGTAVASGYLLDATPVQIWGPASLIFAAGGATATVQILRSYSEGTVL